MQLTPKELYDLDVKERGLVHDEAQWRAVEALHSVYEALLQPPSPAPAPSRWSFFAKKAPPPKPVTGVYLWGGVGRGKTYLIDSFFSCLPFKEKRRVHFQRFMKEVHDSLKELPKCPDPLPIVAQRIASNTRLLCLDEFHVDDVADAMLLAGLLQGLSEERVTLIYTSNIEPDDLYLNGLQRQRFLPAIALIKEHNHVVFLDSPTDYRKVFTSQEHGFFEVSSDKAHETFKTIIERKADQALQWQQTIMINQRELKTVAHGEQLIWLTFADICATAKSYYDYLVIAETYPAVMLSDIPQMNSGMDDVANRFIQLIDALYDHGNELYVSSSAALPMLYTGRQLAFPFQRTQSRLQEMCSAAYLEKRKTT